MADEAQRTFSPVAKLALARAAQLVAMKYGDKTLASSARAQEQEAKAEIAALKAKAAQP